MTQLSSKFIAPNAVNDTHVRLSTNAALRARNNANSADLSILKTTAADVLEFQMLPAVNSGLGIPTAAKQLATIEYIQNYVQGKQQAKSAVNYLATTNVTGTFTGGSTNTLVGVAALTVDGKTFGSGDVVTPALRVALTGQTAGLQNGVYDLTAAGASSFTLTRSTDFDQQVDAAGSEVQTGAYFPVTNGTVNAGYECILTTANPITINTTALTFAVVPTATVQTADDMLLKTGNSWTVDLATNGGLQSTNPGNAAGQLQVKTATGTLEKDRTVQLDASGNVAAKQSKKSSFTLASGDITNQYVDLPDVAATNSIRFDVIGGPTQVEGADYTVNYTGGASSKTRITFAGALATAGASQLVAGDLLAVQYTAF